MRLVRPTVVVFIASFCLALPASVSVAQEDGSYDTTPPSVDSQSFSIDSVPVLVLIEIELSPEGVVGYDSAGARWVYDFEAVQFLASDADAGTEVGSGEGRLSDESIEPVETRCTEPKVVDIPSLTAVYVGRDEYVEGDIVAYNRVTVKGWVKGNVQSFSKTVMVTSTGQVDGNIKAPEVVIREGGIVLGEIVETPPIEIPMEVITSGFSTAGIWVVLGFTLALSLVAFLVATLAPRRLVSMTGCILSHPVKSLLTGFSFIFLLPIIVALVSLTVVGLLVVWVVPLAYFVAFAVGMCATGSQGLNAITRVLAHRTPGILAGSVAGIAFYMGLWALAALAMGSDISGGPGGELVTVIAILVTCYPLMTGTGAAVLTRLGGRVYVSRRETPTEAGEPAPAPAPPPMPESPPQAERRLPRPPTGPIPSDPSSGHR